MLAQRLRPFAAALAVASALAAAHGARAEHVAGSIEIAFVGSATMHDFEGSTAPIRVGAESQPDGTWSGEIAVPVVALDTGIDKRDENMRAMFDASHHPEIHGRFRGVDAEQVKSQAVLPFTLRIREVERPVQAKLSHWKQEDDRHARFDAEFDVSLKDFGLEAPSILFVRVEDVVHVTVHVALERS